MADVKASTGYGNPTLWVAAIQSILILLCSFGKLGFLGLNTQDDVALLVVVLNCLGALYLAWATKNTLLAPVVELLKAVVAFGAIYGLSWTTDQTAMAIVVINSVFAAFHWKATGPEPQGKFTLVA